MKSHQLAQSQSVCLTKLCIPRAQSVLPLICGRRPLEDGADSPWPPFKKPIKFPPLSLTDGGLEQDSRRNNSVINEQEYVRQVQGDDESMMYAGSKARRDRRDYHYQRRWRAGGHRGAAPRLAAPSARVGGSARLRRRGPGGTSESATRASGAAGRD